MANSEGNNSFETFMFDLRVHCVAAVHETHSTLDKQESIDKTLIIRREEVSQGRSMHHKTPWYLSNTCHASYAQLNAMLKDENKLRIFWSEQNHGFWIKFVTRVREFELKKSEFAAFEKIDLVFINILKFLVNKKFSGILTFIKSMRNISGCEGSLPNMDFFIQSHKLKNIKEITGCFEYIFGADVVEGSTSWNDSRDTQHWQQTYKLYKRFLAVFYGLFEIWSKEGNISNFCINWKIPEGWTTLPGYYGAFELFLRDRWGSELLKMLDCSKENVVWWCAPKQPPDKSFSLFPWLPKIVPKEIKQTSVFVKLNLWEILHDLIPPLLAKKYHTMSSIGIADEGKSLCSSAPLLAWFVHYEEFIGKYFMNLLTMRLQSGKEMRHLQTDLTELLKVIMHMRNESMLGAPKYKHQIGKSASEFILEPTVILQVPFHHVIREQWLAASLIEIMKFEIESMELCYWPIHAGKYEKCAKELLNLVSAAKDHILVILNYHHLFCTTGTRPSKSQSETIWDSVQTCVPILELLCQRKASGIVYDIKQKLFATSQKLTTKDGEFLKFDSRVYKTSPNLTDVYANHYWHILYWLKLKYCEKNISLEPDWCKEEAPKPKPLIPCLEEKDFCSQAAYFEEKMLFNCVNSEMPNVKRKLMQKHMEGILNAGYFSDDDTRTLKAKFIYHTLGNENEPNVNIARVFTDLENICNFHQVISEFLRECPTYNNVLSCLVRMSGNVIEREQEVKAVAICAYLLQVTPTLRELDNNIPDNIDMHIKLIGHTVNRCIKKDFFKENFPRLPRYVDVLAAPNLLNMSRKKIELDHKKHSSELQFGDVSINIIKTVDTSAIEWEAGATECKIGKIVQPRALSEDFKKDILFLAVSLMENSFRALLKYIILYNLHGSKKLLERKLYRNYAMEVQYIAPIFLSSIVALAYNPNEKINLQMAQNKINFCTELYNYYLRKYKNFYGNDFTSEVPDRECDINVLKHICQFMGAQYLTVLSWHAPFDTALNNMMHCISEIPYAIYKKLSAPFEENLKRFINEAYYKTCYNFIATIAIITGSGNTCKYVVPGSEFCTEPVYLLDLEEMKLQIQHALVIKIIMYLYILGQQNPSMIYNISDYECLIPAFHVVKLIDPRRMTARQQKIIKCAWLALLNIRKKLIFPPKINELIMPENVPVITEHINYYVDNSEKLTNTPHFVEPILSALDSQMTLKKWFNMLKSHAALESKTEEIKTEFTQVTWRDQYGNGPFITKLVCLFCGVMERLEIKHLRFIPVGHSGNSEIYAFCSEDCLSFYAEENNWTKVHRLC